MPETTAPETAQAETIPEAALHAAMDAFYPGEDWRRDLGQALPSSLRDMEGALKAAALTTPTGAGTETREAAVEAVYQLGKEEGAADGIQRVAERIGIDSEYRWSSDPERSQPGAVELLERIVEHVAALAPATPAPAVDGVEAWELAEERKRADLFVARANQLETALEPFDKFSNTSFADGELCTIRVYARELPAVGKALATRTPAGAAGDLVGEASRVASLEAALETAQADARDARYKAQCAEEDECDALGRAEEAEAEIIKLRDELATRPDSPAPDLEARAGPRSREYMARVEAVHGVLNDRFTRWGWSMGEASQSQFVEDLVDAALARSGAPAVDVPAERRRIADAMRSYLRVCACGGMPADQRKIVEDAVDNASGTGYFDAILAPRPTDQGGARGWEPIKTAPKDGTHLMCLTVLPSGPEYNIGRFCDDGWHEEAGWYCDGGSDITPTHWRPLPEPPAASTASTDAGEGAEEIRIIQSAFARGDRVRKTGGASWQGHVCGHYSTDLTPDGVCVESERESGSVQIYPAKALALVTATAPAAKSTASSDAGGV